MLRKLCLLLLLSPILFAQDQQYDAARQAIQNITSPSLSALDQYKAASDAQISSLQVKVQQFSQQVTDLQAQLAQTNQTDQATIATLQQELDSAEASLETAKITLTLAQAQIVLLQSQVSPPGFADLQMQADWAVHVNDPTIGPWASGASYSFAQFQKQGDELYALQLGVQGVAGYYSDVLWSITRKPLPPAGKVVYTGRIWVDANTATGAQAIEIDTIISKASLRYNFSSQINVAKGWMLQVSGETPWKDTGCIVGPLASGQWHNFEWDYIWNDVSHQYSFLRFQVDSTVCNIPASLQNMTASSTNWSDSLHPQAQLDSNAKGIGFKVWYADLTYHFPQ